MYADWGKLDDDQKATCVLMNIHSLSSQLSDTFLVWRQGMASTVPGAQEVAGENAGRRASGRTPLSFPGTANNTSRPPPGSMRAVSTTVTGDETWGTYIERVATKFKTMSIKATKTVFNVKWMYPELDEGVENIKFSKRANFGVRAFASLMVVAGIASVIAMSVSLANHWEEFNDLGKALMVTNIVLTVVSLAVDMLSMAFTACVALPFVGALLALAGLIVTIFMMKKDIQEEKEPELSDVELYVRDTARPFIQDMDVTVPSPSLTYSIDGKTQASSGDPAITFAKGQIKTLQVRAVNNGTAAVTIEEVASSFLCGDDDNALFDENSFAKHAHDGEILAGETMATREVGYTRIKHTESVLLELSTSGELDGPLSVGVRFFGGLLPDGITRQQLTLQPGEGFVFSMRGKIGDIDVDADGDAEETGEVFVEIVESYESGDKAMKKFRLKRE